jgi:hypothetical protein
LNDVKKRKEFGHEAMRKAQIKAAKPTGEEVEISEV